MRAWRTVALRRTAVTGALAAALALGVTAMSEGAALPTGGARAALAATCGTDEFDAAALDDARWDVIRPAAAPIGVSGGKLGIGLAQTDMISGTANAALVLQDAPAGGWTATTKFNIGAVNENGKQVGLVLWKSEGTLNNTFAKATFIQTNNGTRQFEAVWTDKSDTAFPTGTSGTPAPAGLAPDADVLLRMRSDGLHVKAEFSADDGATWTQIGQTAAISGPVRVGVLALRGSANTTPSTAMFERFTLSCGPEVSVSPTPSRGTGPLEVNLTATATDDGAGPLDLSWDFGDGATATGGTSQLHTYANPGTYRATVTTTDADGNTTQGSTLVTVLAADPPCPVANDEFTGSALDPKWQVLRSVPSRLDVTGGMLRLGSMGGDMSGGTASARNVLLQNAPTGPWTMTTKIDVTQLTATGDQVGLLLWRGEGPNNFAKIVWNRRSGTTWWIERSNTVGGSTANQGNGNTGAISSAPTDVYIRAVSDGAANPSITAFYSTDGTTFNPVQGAFQVGGSGPLKVGLNYFQGSALKSAGFDYFHLEGAQACGAADTTAPLTQHTLSPAAPAGGEWFLSPPQVTLTAVDDASGSGINTTEYRVDGGAWTTYTGPFQFPAGNHTIDYHSVDRAGNAEADRSFTAKVDGAAPTTTAALDPASPGPGGRYDGPVTVSLTGDDGPDGSGVDATQYRVDGGPWTNYNDPAEETIFDGTQASLDQWVQAGPGGFDLQSNGSIQGHGGLGMLWYPVKEYGDFSLKFQFRDVRPGTDFANGGAFVRFPDLRNVPVDQRPNCGKTGSAQTAFEWVAIFCGHEIQIYDGPTGEVQKTGSIYNFQPLNLTQAKPTPKGDWNDYEIRVVGQQYTIIRNGEVINRFDNSIPKSSSRAGDPPTQDRQFASGYIGLQNHSDADVVQYRNIRVSSLPGAASGAFTISANGQHTVEYRSRDVAGNLEAAKSVEFSIGEPEPVNIFDTIGITEEATRANSQIFGDPESYSLPAEEMPPSRSIVQDGPSDTQDDVPFRMPNTSGTVANMAAFHGQTVILRTSESKPYAKVHFFGTTTDGGPAGGDFVLKYSDNTTQTVNVQFRDWCDPGDPTAAHHIAIGPLTHRHTETGSDGAPCGIYHVPVTIDPAKTLVTVKLPSTTTPGNPPIQGYLMALTLEQPDGGFVTPDLGASAFPDDLTAPTATATLGPAAPQGQNGWYTSNVSVTLDAADEQGGSGLDTIEYRIDGGAFQDYTQPFDVTDEGGHVVEYRARDKAGNTAAPKSVDVKIDRLVPATTARLSPAHPGASGWYDDAVTLTLRGNDGPSGSGIQTSEYRIGSGPWQAYSGPVVLSQVGTYAISYRSTDMAGNAETEGPPTEVKVDNRAPVTTAELTSAQEPTSSGAFRAPVRVALASSDGAGSGVAGTEYAVDGGTFAPYTGPFTVSETGGHLVEFRSIDAAGNRENTKDQVFAITSTAAGNEQPPPDAFVGLGGVPDRLRVGSLLSRGLRVSATCVSVGHGTLTLKVSRKLARRLKLETTTLARRAVTCGDSLQVSAKLKPSRKLARRLRRAKGTFKATLTLRMSGVGGRAGDSEVLVLRGRKRGG
jgi:PKD repeat protein